MKNERGTVLIITLMFALAFTLMGLASIETAGMENQGILRKNFSTQAFWLAEAAVERARAHLPDRLFASGDAANTGITLGPGQYDVSSQPDVLRDENGNIIHTFQLRWVVEGKGFVRNHRRAIRMILSGYDLDRVLKTRGPVKDFDKCPMASIAIDCSKVEELANFSFEETFEGFTVAQLKALADQTFNDPPNNSIGYVSGITVINLIDNNQVQIPSDKFQGDGFLLVDATEAQAKGQGTATVQIEGGGFNGILWIIGDAKLAGNPNVNGAIYVESSATDVTSLTGTGVMTYDPAAIDNALVHLSMAFGTVEPDIIHWQEI